MTLIYIATTGKNIIKEVSADHYRAMLCY